MRRTLELLLLLPALALASAGRTPAVLDPPSAEPPASIATATVDPCTALLPSSGIGFPVRAAAQERSGGPGGRRCLPDRGRLESAPPPALHRDSVRTRAIHRLEFGAADALERSGVHSWGTAAPPPLRSV